MVLRNHKDQTDFFSVLDGHKRPPRNFKPPFDLEPFCGERFNPDEWLAALIGAKIGTSLIFLYGESPSVCLVRCESPWEEEERELVARVWVNRTRAVKALENARYRRHSIYIKGDGKGLNKAIVYRRSQ